MELNVRSEAREQGGGLNSAEGRAWQYNLTCAIILDRAMLSDTGRKDARSAGPKWSGKLRSERFKLH